MSQRESKLPNVHWLAFVMGAFQSTLVALCVLVAQALTSNPWLVAVLAGMFVALAQSPLIRGAARRQRKHIQARVVQSHTFGKAVLDLDVARKLRDQITDEEPKH